MLCSTNWAIGSKININARNWFCCYLRTVLVICTNNLAIDTYLYSLYFGRESNPYGHCCPRDFLTTIIFTTNCQMPSFWFNIGLFFNCLWSGLSLNHIEMLQHVIIVIICQNSYNYNFNLGSFYKVSAHCLSMLHAICTFKQWLLDRGALQSWNFLLFNVEISITPLQLIVLIIIIDNIGSRLAY